MTREDGIACQIPTQALPNQPVKSVIKRSMRGLDQNNIDREVKGIQAHLTKFNLDA